MPTFSPLSVELHLPFSLSNLLKAKGLNLQQMLSNIVIPRYYLSLNRKINPRAKGSIRKEQLTQVTAGTKNTQKRQNPQGLGNVAEHIQSPKPRNFGEKTHTTHVSGNQTSSTLSTTEPSENLGNNPLEILLLSLEARLEIGPGQEFFVHELGRFFISPEVESYTKGTDSGSVVNSKSLFAMTMFFKKKLSEKPKEWKQKFLPYTFGNKDNEARLLVATELFEWAAPKATSYSNKEIKDKFQDVNVQQRFALLCGATYQHFHNHEAPWPEVNEQLEKLKKHTSRFRHA
ncbi:hypothetical protein BY996DRAFT_6424967 [Phakopsora pachyrhizi]|nr:hypothetical protein BY996DRAFT_6424967 [Phakopsora pachyrhizi]